MNSSYNVTLIKLAFNIRIATFKDFNGDLTAHENSYKNLILSDCDLLEEILGLS